MEKKNLKPWMAVVFVLAFALDIFVLSGFFGHVVRSVGHTAPRDYSCAAGGPAGSSVPGGPEESIPL